MESDHVHINNVNVQSDNITHDGIDIVDGSDVLVENCAVTSGDDAMCLKSGVRRGLDSITVRDSIFTGSNGGSNGIKFGTATYGDVKNIAIHDVYVKNIQHAALAVESRHGSDVNGVAFQRIGFDNVGGAFFVYLAQQAVTAPTGDVPKLGSMNNISFTDITGSTAHWDDSPHQGSLITGHIFNGTTYYVTNVSFTNVAVRFTGGLNTVPGMPVEAMPNQYPESNMFGDLPAWAYYLRHVQGAVFTNCTSTLQANDARQKIVTNDTTGVMGDP
jgi:polygalacturonase